MMRWLAIAWLAVLAATPLAHGADGPAPLGFRDLKFGSFPPEDLHLKYVGNGIAKNPANPLPTFAGHPVSEEFYMFDRERFFYVGIAIPSRDMDAIRSYLRSLYGEPDFYNPNDGLKTARLKWPSDRVEVGAYFSSDDLILVEYQKELKYRPDGLLSD